MQTESGYTDLIGFQFPFLYFSTGDRMISSASSELSLRIASNEIKYFLFTLPFSFKFLISKDVLILLTLNLDMLLACS